MAQGVADSFSSSSLSFLAGRYSSVGSVTPSGPVRFTSAATADVPVMAGNVFPKGHFPAGNNPVTNHAGVHAVIKRRWNDGSAKHVIIAGMLNTGGSYADVVISGGALPAAPLTEAAIVSAAPTAVVTLGSIGTVSLSDLLGSPVRTWVATPNMVECHYLGKIGSDWYVWFHVKRWAAGHTHVRVVVEYSTLPYTNTSVSYTPSVTIGGVEVFNNGGAAYVHAKNTRWTVEGWAHGGATVTVKHDSATLLESKLTPKYFGTPSESNLNALVQTYTPGYVSNIRTAYESGGYHAQIGLLPQWDADYITSTDERARKAMIASSLSMGQHATIWRDPNTNAPVRPTDRPTWGFSGNGGGGHTAIAAENQVGGYYSWDIAHHASPGYLAYLITGDYVHLENLQMHGASIFLGAGNYQWSGPATATGTGVNRVLEGQTRAIAWSMRTLGQLAGIAPDSDMGGTGVAGDYALWLNNLATWYKANGQDLAPSGIGYPLTIGTYNPSAPLTSAPWMHNFWIQSMGYVSDLEPISNMATFNALRDWMYRGVVGVLGDGTAGTYDYRYGGMYNITSSATVRPNYAITYASGLYGDWGSVYSAMLANLNAQTETSGYTQPQNATGATLYSTYGSIDYGYWGNLLPAIAYAVDHQAAGADDAMLRVINATNYSTVTAAVGGQRSWAVTSRRAPVATGIWSAENVPGTYNSGTFAWTPGRGADGRVTAASWALVPQDTWVSVATTNITTLNAELASQTTAAYGVAFNDPGSGKLAAVIDAFSGIANDSAGGRFWAFGGGHNDSANNGLYRFDLNKMAWAIEQIPDNSANWNIGSGAGQYKDPWTDYNGSQAYRTANPSSDVTHDEFFDPDIPAASTRNPTARHTYGSMVYSPERNSVIFGVRALWEYNLTTRAWSKKIPFNTPTGSYNGSTGYGGGAGYGTWHAATQSYVFGPTENGNASNYWRYNYTTNDWAWTNSFPSEWWYAASAQAGGAWLSMPAPNGAYPASWPPNVRRYDLTTGVTTTISLTHNILLANCQNGYEEGMVFAQADGTGNRFLASFKYNEGTGNSFKTFTVDLAAQTLTRDTSWENGAWPGADDLVKNKIFYSAALNALVFVNRGAQNIYIRKLA